MVQIRSANLFGELVKAKAKKIKYEMKAYGGGMGSKGKLHQMTSQNGKCKYAKWIRDHQTVVFCCHLFLSLPLSLLGILSNSLWNAIKKTLNSRQRPGFERVLVSCTAYLPVNKLFTNNEHCRLHGEETRARQDHLNIDMLQYILWAVVFQCVANTSPNKFT